ncbi:MAG TPA: DUF4097 family beta strand repeat-containing protein [Cryobacterium sp.]|nr:DUF4097 family beta strand repeat-containing protein [Cryobacterium sp.]
MTETPIPPPPATRMSRGSRIALIVTLSVVAVAVVVAVVVGVVLIGTILRGGAMGGSYADTASAAAGNRVLATVPNASVDLRPSPDDRVHVDARGTYFGTVPTLQVTTAGGVTSISGGCPSQWFGFCSVELTVRLPASLPLNVLAQNGGLSVTGLTGALDLVTTNGAIATVGTRGDLALETTNGAIDVRDAGSRRVTATTTNGRVELGFLDPPTSVQARSTNGAVTVSLPTDGVTYRVDARTTNGEIDSGSVPSDPSSRRSITAATTNGRVTVEAR